MQNYKGFSKYHSQRIRTKEGKFDSEREFCHYQKLKIMQAAGMIQNLQRQVIFTLIPSQKTSKGTERPVKYIADFVYESDGKRIVEDVKGYKTPEYIIKRKLMLYILGIEVQEV